MKLLKIKLDEDCQIIAVADDEDVILTAGAFTNDDNAETASNVLYTLLVSLGQVKSTTAPKRMKISDLVKTIGENVNVYEKNL